MVFPYITWRNVYLHLKIIIPANVAEAHVVCGQQQLAQTAEGEGGVADKGTTTVIQGVWVLE